MNPLESPPEDTDSESDSDWEEEDTHDDGNANRMEMRFLKIKRHPQHFLLHLIFDNYFICFLSSYFCFLKGIPKLQFQTFCFTPPFLSPNCFLNF